MKVKGVAFLARQQMMVGAHGEQTWKNFLSGFAKRYPEFGQPVLPISQLDTDAFVALNDELVDRFYGGDRKVYWKFGEASGHYAVSQGQLKGMFGKGDGRRFLQMTPAIWRSYFTEGELSVTFSPGGAELRITGVSTHHVYFEYTVMGFAVGGLSAMGYPNVKPEVVKGFSKGDAEIDYRFPVA